MLVAVQGCSHGSLAAIYDSIARFELVNKRTVDLLLLCGDFQALRSRHDFPSLAVPPKYHQLGTFHEYYAGRRRAPVLTLVIGGNHEASNYMWELYHGGWLAENIYYMGAAGCVNVGGVRVVGASGIYKSHDYTKGHYETVPYNSSTLRSIYHIRQYDVARLMLLPPAPNTITLSHDWPTTIPHHGNTSALLKRKPFFADEVRSNTLGSPPLLQLMRHLQPEHWFSAHLHVKFAAVYEHGKKDAAAAATATGANGANGATQATSNPDEIDISDDDDVAAQPVASAANPDEIDIDEDDEPVDIAQPAPAENGEANPDEIALSDDEAPHADAQAALQVDESVDLVEKARETDPHAAQGVIGITEQVGGDAPSQNGAIDAGAEAAGEAGPSRPRRTKFLALDKCGPGKDFIQFLDIPTPSSAVGSSALASEPAPSGPIELTYDPQWLAITRAMHPFLSLEMRQTPLPAPDHLAKLVQAELERIRVEGVRVPRLSKPAAQAADGADGVKEEEGAGDADSTRAEGAEGVQTGAGEDLAVDADPLEWVKGPVRVERVQKFWPTAPPEGQPGGSPSAWYTNPQTVAFCGMLGIENRINPAPPVPPAANV